MDFTPLLRWSRSEFSHLPWRMNRSLYRTLVSEIMLQQTTVGTVKNHFERFLQVFPDLETLAKASEQELLVAWKGLGYYRRAKNLKKIAEAIVHEHRGKIPRDIERLREIPGIGPYTANALVAIGMDQRGLAVDANLERVIARLYGISLPKGPKLQKEIARLFEEMKIFPGKISYRELNEALMDLGRTFCQARKASCELCPLRPRCQAFSAGAPLSLPVEAGEKKKSAEHELSLLRAYVVKKGKILVYLKEDGEWLSGQFEVPTFILSSSDEKLGQYPRLRKSLQGKTPVLKTGITKYKIANHLLTFSEEEFGKLGFPRKLVWKEIKNPQSNFSTTTLKGLRALKLD